MSKKNRRRGARKRHGAISERRRRSPSQLAVPRDEEFNERMQLINKAHRRQTKGRLNSRCLVPIQDGNTCVATPIYGHSIQRSILSSMADRGKVAMFPRDIPNIVSRLITSDQSQSAVSGDASRWYPKEIGVREASTGRFACERHDSSAFGPIERTGSDLRHPLYAPALTGKLKFLISYRIVMMELDRLVGVGRARYEFRNEMRRDRLRPYGIWMYRERVKAVEKIKSLYDKCYLGDHFDAPIDTPIDDSIFLPIRVAASDIYTPRSKVGKGEMHVTLYPSNTAGDISGIYQHRIIVSRLHDAYRTDGTNTDEFKHLIDEAKKPGEGASILLGAVLIRMRNVFFSYRDYQQLLSEQDRIDLERGVHKDLKAAMNPYFAGRI